MSKQLRKKQHVYQSARSATRAGLPLWKNRRVQWSALTLAIVAVIGLIFITRGDTFTPEVFGTPRAAIASTHIDHGDVPIEKFVEDEFVIKNISDQQLRILDKPQIRVLEGCCPPAVHLDEQYLEPGEEATIHMEYTMHAGMAGPHLFEITVETNDPDNPTIVFTSRSNWIE